MSAVTTTRRPTPTTPTITKPFPPTISSPANHLEQLLFAEANHMASLVVDDKVFGPQRDVVKEELRSRMLSQLYGKLFYVYYPNISYAAHPYYARPSIGSIAQSRQRNAEVSAGQKSLPLSGGWSGGSLTETS